MGNRGCRGYAIHVAHFRRLGVLANHGSALHQSARLRLENTSSPLICSHIMRCGVVWCGVVCVVWCGVVWCGVVWCGVVWCGVVWCGNRRGRVVVVCMESGEVNLS